jgi:hypothetical protein
MASLAELVATTWSDNAAEAQFAGMTLAQFKAAVQPTADTRNELLSLNAQRRAKQNERNAADNAARDLIQRVIAAIRADAAHGADSPLLTAIGYVARSARKSGKTNKAQTAQAGASVQKN